MSRSRPSRVALTLAVLLCVALVGWVLLQHSDDISPVDAPGERPGSRESQEPPTLAAPARVPEGHPEPALAAAHGEPETPAPARELPPLPFPVDVQIVSAEDGRRLDAVYGVGLAGNMRLSLRVEDPPKGLLAWDSSDWSIPDCPGTRRLRVVYPLRREARVTGTVVGPRGERVGPGARTTVRAHGMATTVVYRAGGDDFSVLRVPFIPGMLVEGSSQAQLGGQDMWGSGAVRIGHDPSAEHVLEIRLDPAVDAPPGASMLGLPNGAASAAFTGRSGGPAGSIRVLVLRRDGLPLLGGRVRLSAGGTKEGRTDDRGEVVFEKVPPGEAVVSAGQPGFVPISAPVTVEESRETYVVLREPEGGRLNVLVVDADGRPASFALLMVRQPSRAPWVDIDEAGVLRLDPYTDHLGRREIRGLEAGTIRILASLGPLVGEAEAVVLDGRTSDVRLVCEGPDARK